VTCAMIDNTSIAGYDVISVLGQGARSTIYAVRDRDNSTFALKRVVKKEPKDQRFLEQAIREHEVASHFNSPLIRQSYKVVKQRAFIRTSEILVLMELVKGVALDRQRPANMLEMVQVARQAAEGLEIMHKAGFVHADIKPNNILVLDDKQIKLIDFGQSCKIGTIKERIQGTPDYIAPEQVLRREITPRTDVFNLGATLYWLLTNKHVPTLIPKRDTTTVALRTDDGCPPPHEVNPDVPLALSTLVMQCLEPDPLDRPESMKSVADRLEVAAAQLARLSSAAASEAAKTTAVIDSNDDDLDFDLEKAI